MAGNWQGARDSDFGTGRGSGRPSGSLGSLDGGSDRKKKTRDTNPLSTLRPDTSLDSLGSQYRLYQQPPSYTYNPQTGGSYTVGDRFNPNKIYNPNPFRDALSASYTNTQDFNGRPLRELTGGGQKLFEAQRRAALSDGDQVRAFSGRAARPRDHTPNHPAGNAIDVAIAGPGGSYLPNSPEIARAQGQPLGPSFRPYESFAQDTKRELDQSGYGGPLRWGGYFSGKPVAADLMHMDVTPRIGTAGGSLAGGATRKQLAAIPGARSAPMSATDTQIAAATSPAGFTFKPVDHNPFAKAAAPPRRTAQGDTGANPAERRVTVADVPELPAASMQRFGARPPVANDAQVPAPPVRTAQGDTGAVPAAPPVRTAQGDTGAYADAFRRVVQGAVPAAPPQQVASAERKSIIPKDGILGLRGRRERGESIIPKDGILGVRGAVRRAEGKIIPKDGLLGLRGIRNRGEDALPGETGFGRVAEHLPIVGPFMRGAGALDRVTRRSSPNPMQEQDDSVQATTQVADNGADVGSGRGGAGLRYIVPPDLLPAILSAAKQAPDGVWYVSDPDDPNKFYKVNSNA